MEFPDDLRYTSEHEWARLEGARVRVGITDFAQDALGDVVYVDLPEVGAAVQAATPFGEVESTKSVSDVYSPVTGTIVERNPLIEERPELVNEQPYVGVNGAPANYGMRLAAGKTHRLRVMNILVDNDATVSLV